MLALGDPQGLIDPVDAPVAELAVGIVEELSETARVDLAVERAQRRGAAPHFPVETLWNRLVVARLLRPVAAAIDEAADRADLPGLAGAEEFPRGYVVR